MTINVATESAHGLLLVIIIVVVITIETWAVVTIVIRPTTALRLAILMMIITAAIILLAMIMIIVDHMETGVMLPLLLLNNEPVGTLATNVTEKNARILLLLQDMKPASIQNTT